MININNQETGSSIHSRSFTLLYMSMLYMNGDILSLVTDTLLWM